MRRSLLTTPERTEALESLFGASSEMAREVLDVIEAEPTRSWQPDEVVAATGVTVVDVMIVLARLTAGEMILHDGLGAGYRAVR